MPARPERPRSWTAGPAVPLALYALVVFLPPLRHAPARAGWLEHALLTLAVPVSIALLWWAGARLVAAFRAGLELRASRVRPPRRAFTTSCHDADVSETVNPRASHSLRP